MACRCKLWTGMRLVLLLWSFRQQLFWQVQITAAFLASYVEELIWWQQRKEQHFQQRMSWLGWPWSVQRTAVHVVNLQGFCEPLEFWMYATHLGWSWKQIGFRIQMYTMLLNMLSRMNLAHIEANDFHCVEQAWKINTSNAASHLYLGHTLQPCVPLDFWRAAQYICYEVTPPTRFKHISKWRINHHTTFHA